MDKPKVQSKTIWCLAPTAAVQTEGMRILCIVCSRPYRFRNHVPLPTGEGGVRIYEKACGCALSYPRSRGELGVPYVQPASEHKMNKQDRERAGLRPKNFKVKG